MTVGELMEQLLEYPATASVEVSTPDYLPITMVVRRPETGSVCLIPGEAAK